MPDEMTMCPFRRSIAGLRGTVLLRRHEDHAKHSAEAIRRRNHPAWSSQSIAPLAPMASQPWEMRRG